MTAEGAMTAKEPLFDLFVSFAEADRAWVQGVLADALNQAGVRWQSEETFQLGAPRLVEFERAQAQSRRIVLVLSPAYLEEHFLRFLQVVLVSEEVKSGEWRVIPVMIQRVALPSWLDALSWLDATDSADWPVIVQRLLHELNRPLPLPAPSPPCPYPGMRPFTEADSAQFFGRAQMVSEIVERLRLHPNLTLIGPSGSGKSSLLYAGLIPELKRSRRFPDAAWQILDLRPGPQPLERLAATLAAHLPTASAEIAASLAQNPAQLSDYLKQITASPRRHCLLLIDQCEEIFAQCKDAEKRRLFLEALGHVLQTRPERCFLLLAVRSDFYGHLQESALWSQIKENKLDLPPLTPAELREAILRPAETVGVYLEPALVERLLADAAGERGVLPLLQETLRQLWDQLQGYRLITVAAYEALGQEGRSGLQVALTRHANAALAGLLGDQQKEIARRIFIRLVEFGEQRHNTRRQQPITALRAESDPSAVFQDVLETLIQHRLLTTSADPATGATAIDLTHEKLLEVWPQLNKWLETYQAMEEGRRSLELAAEAWNQNHRDSSFLFAGARLRQAETWAGQWPQELGSLEKAFLTASRLREQKQRQQRLIGLAAVAVVALLLVYVGGRAVYRESVRRTAGTELVVFPAGPALIGTEDPEAEDDERPQRTAALLAFAIEKYEVSNRQYEACRRSGPCTEPKDSADLYLEAERGEQPVVGVTAVQAAAYCQWIGRRLPTSVEWERAVRGAEGRSWPWAADSPPTPERVALLLPDAPAYVPADSVPVAAMPAGASPEGVYHLVGNVAEWVIFVPKTCDGQACHTAWDGQTETIAQVGSSYDNYLDRITEISRYDPDAADVATGFRCATRNP